VADSPTPTTAAVGTTKSPSEAAVLLVTGFPGLRARALVRQALGADAELRPLLLVHPERLERAMGVLSSLPGGERARLVGGDPAAIDFGLGRTDYARLAEEVRVVHHVYQVIDLAAPGEVAEAVNVGGAREMIELCRVAKKLERVVHYSSVFVSGDRTGIVLERDLHSHQSFRSPVAASLALAEAMLRRHREVPLTVVRTAQVVGDTESGFVDRLDGLYPLLVFLANAPNDVPLPLPPKIDTPLHLVPVDYVAKAALAAGVLPETLGETLHLVDPRPLTTRRLLELAAARFGKLLAPGFNPGVLGSLINNPGVGLLAQQLRAVGDLITRDVTYDDATATARLAPNGIRCPPLESYLDVLLAHVEARAHDKGSMRPKEPADVVG
jgi:nucleoside-diphosphate-sugar epimerase